jgi:hypothetical protein
VRRRLRVHAARRRKQVYAILACYYGALAMGILYWLVYDIITSYTPKIFYVSDLCWMASYLFLLMLVTETAGPEERAFRHPAAWISPVVSTALTVFYCQWGDWLENVVWCGLMGAAGWFSIRGCIWAARQKDTAGGTFTGRCSFSSPWNTACGRRPASGPTTVWPTPTSGSISG